MAHEFGALVLGQPERQQTPDGQRVLGRPRRRLDAEHLQLERPLPSLDARRRGIDAFGITGQGRARRRTEPRQLSLGRGADSEGEHPLVDGQRGFAEHFRQPAIGRPAVELHLPEAVAGVEGAGHEPGVRRVARVHVRHPEAIVQHFDRTTQTSQPPLAVQ